MKYYSADLPIGIKYKLKFIDSAQLSWHDPRGKITM